MIDTYENAIKIGYVRGMHNLTYDTLSISNLPNYNFNVNTVRRKTKESILDYVMNHNIEIVSDGKGNTKSFYVHQIICKAFLPNHTDSWGIRHKDGDVTNNALENLEWLGRKKERDGVMGLDTDRLELNENLSDYIKLVHLSAIKKGIPVPDTYEFFHGILNESLNEYINRFGLKKTMYQIEN